MKGKVNAVWHNSHPMAVNPSEEQRVAWHAEHSEACGCRPVPPSLRAEVYKLKRKANGRGKA